jgi:hypothetical protein
VAAYVDALTRLGRKPASIRQAVWAIATLHLAAALADPSKAEVVRLALKRMARTLGTRQRQAAPLEFVSAGLNQKVIPRRGDDVIQHCRWAGGQRQWLDRFPWTCARASPLR